MEHTGENKRIAALTLGCKVNAYDTEAMLELFSARGYRTVAFDEPADVYLVNTCTVTSLSDKKSRQMLRRARRQNPGAIVVAAGCYAQVSPEEVLAVDEVDLAVGTKDRLCIVDIVEDCAGRQGRVNGVTDIMTERVFEPLTVSRQENRTRAFLKIQEGCDQYCSYCVIPYARGHIRSRAEDDVIAEAQRLSQSGYREIVLSGIHVASYGKDLGGTDLLTVVSKVHALEGIRRIRLSSVEPGIVTPAFVSGLLRLPKLCPHFHLSLQSGCDRTLARMNRKYTTAQYRAAAMRLREAMPDVALTTDVIVGFPGETDADFDASCAFVQEMGFARIHVFPFAPKKRTPAAEYPDQVPASEKSARAARMIALGKRLTRRFLDAHIGREVEVLFETEPEPGVYEGYSAEYVTVRTASAVSLCNEIWRVTIRKRAGERLVGMQEPAAEKQTRDRL